MKNTVQNVQEVPQAPRKRGKKGSASACQMRLWAALERASKLLENDDPTIALKACSVVATLGPAYLKLLKPAEQERHAKNFPSIFDTPEDDEDED